jgi:hypothetical protein
MAERTTWPALARPARGGSPGLCPCELVPVLVPVRHRKWGYSIVLQQRVDQRRKPAPEAELRVLRGFERRLAEACGGRTHQPGISGFAGFEDQEGHRAHSASVLPENSGGSEMLSSYFRRLEVALSSGLAFDTIRMQGHLFVDVARAL